MVHNLKDFSAGGTGLVRSHPYQFIIVFSLHPDSLKNYGIFRLGLFRLKDSNLLNKTTE